ncbi:MAG: MOSC domain-containing protein [Chloroflexota bacterium]|nr:MOSC domain-containing protein [Chloroflexota bacterium]
MTDKPRIFQISASKEGGVPKHARREAQIDSLGIVGSRVAHPEDHGGPERALCLYSLERILALQAEGHPLFPGSIGENITTVNLDWEQIGLGACLRLGAQVVIQVTRYTSPCETIAASFVDGHYDRISQKRYAGWSRVYARVLRPGRFRVGDRIEFITVEMTS